MVTCRNCGWVHFALTRAEAEAEVAEFNAFYHQQTQETKDNYGGRPSHIGKYEFCFVCSKQDFYPSLPGDAPRGCTINPIIYEDF